MTLHLGAFRCKKVLPATAINLFVFLGVVCLVPRPLHFVAVEPFRLTWSERSCRVRHRNGLTRKAWKKAVQEQGKGVIKSDARLSFQP